MNDVLFQIVFPFILSAFVVIIITVIAELYGTKIGGIIGTLPSTIVIAFIFIAINKGVNFASKSVIVVPAEMGINLFIIFMFSILVHKSLIKALTGSFAIWASLSSMIYFLRIENIFFSLVIYAISFIFTFFVLEKIINVGSLGKVKVNYSTKKIALRGILTGTIVTISVLLSNIDEVLSGIFSVFPAIFASTMIITAMEHGPDFASALTKSMIFGSVSVMSYAVLIHFLYPIYGIITGSMIAFIISVFLSLIVLLFRGKIR